MLDSVIEYDVVCSILKGNAPQGSVVGAIPLEGAGEPKGSVDASSSSGGAIFPAALCVDVRHDPALEEVPPTELEAIVDDSASVTIERDAQWVAVTNDYPEPSPAKSGFDEARSLAVAKVVAPSLRHAKSCPGRAPDGSVAMATTARLLPSEMQHEDVVILAARPRARGPASRDTKPRYHGLVVE